MTGADSPVIADSSTEATPSVISPSEGMMSLASHTTRSPFNNSGGGDHLLGAVGPQTPGLGLRAHLAQGVGLALPRPSAMASAKLAKITVRNSQTVIDQSKMPGCAMDSIRVMIDPTSTTNMTGFLIWTRGSNFLEGADQRTAQDLGVE